MTDSIKHFTDFDISGKSEIELFDAARAMGIDVDSTMGKGKLIDEILVLNEGNYTSQRSDYPKKCPFISHTATIQN
jgi:lysyl-tRNA synthetase class 2